ncbi:uncharacterized protein LOC133188069 [Saccostrea echinata]|uniref:uncharacterized protein LOC133188069 n=1 Tax=Saccostrea echinata TaxID=191078 RepID=UPI002A822542|nr:uncharacterized protein LOC133188069 [Saccostrea echinata]
MDEQNATSMDLDFLELAQHFEYNNSIDDQTLSQIEQLIEDEVNVFDGIGDLSLTQIDFNLTQEPVKPENVIKQLDHSDDRFGKFYDDDDMENLLKSTESKNTRKNTSWSVKTFKEWRSARIFGTGSEIPELEHLIEPALINKWLGKFVVEARRKDGQPYPPKSLYMLCIGILRYFRECGIHENFLDEKDSKFYEFRRILSARMSELTVLGVGTRPKQAEPISKETENELWEKGLLGDWTGKALLNTMFFYICKLFGLRGVDEHRGMEIDQTELGVDRYGHFVKFKGRSNKTFKGGLAQRHVQAKEMVHHFQNMMLYNMYQKYIEIITKCGESRAFYRRALENGPNNELRFSQQAICVNKLAVIMKTIFRRLEFRVILRIILESAL